MHDCGFGLYKKLPGGGVGPPVFSGTATNSAPPEKSVPSGKPGSSPQAPTTPEDEEFTEGDKRAQQHLRRERASGLARKKKDAFVAEHGELFCEHCKMRPGEVYDNVSGSACIEVHHIRPLGENEGAVVTTLADLECLCANCHRVEHRRMKNALKAHAK